MEDNEPLFWGYILDALSFEDGMVWYFIVCSFIYFFREFSIAILVSIICQLRTYLFEKLSLHFSLVYSIIHNWNLFNHLYFWNQSNPKISSLMVLWGTAANSVKSKVKEDEPNSLVTVVLLAISCKICSNTLFNVCHWCTFTW